MADINQAVQELVKAAQDLKAARDKNAAAIKDEEAKRKQAWDIADKKLAKAKTREEIAAAKREYDAAQAEWREADTTRKKAALALRLAEKTFRQKAKQFNEALWGLVSP